MSTSLGSNGSMPEGGCGKLLVIKNLTLQTPRSRNILITDLSLELNDGDRLLVMGPSGSGKTSLLRALAGLWNTGEGNITFYLTNRAQSQLSGSLNIDSPEARNMSEVDKGLLDFKNKRSKDVFFLPQRPYMALGTLRQQLLYPAWSNESILTPTNSQQIETLPFLLSQTSRPEGERPDKPTAEDLMQVLEVVRLGDIISRFNGLDSIYEWSSVLSLGEQQRLAFARLFLSKPRLVLLDECTSALDEANEAHLYSQIEAAGITYVSIGHRSTLYKYHNKGLRISKFNSEKPGQQNWHFEPISQKTTPEQATPTI